MDRDQSKIFEGSFDITQSLNLLDGMQLQISGNRINFIRDDEILLSFQYDLASNIEALDGLTKNKISVGNIPGIKLRLIGWKPMKSASDINDITYLLGNIGFRTPGFIYIVPVDISKDILKNGKYFLVMNSSYATMFQMFKSANNTMMNKSS
jgi:hypothetical protein